MEKVEYKRNKLGEITKRQRVDIKCDRCDGVWTTTYAYRKRKTRAEDLCRSCCSSENLKTQTPLNSRRWGSRNETVEVLCSCCGNAVYKFPSAAAGVHYCNIECRDNARRKKYEHLEESFRGHPDEVAYLFGLILGDGNQRKVASQTTRIMIAFDAHDTHAYLLNEAKRIMNNLKIAYYIEPTVKQNCLHLGFTLPDTLLAKYEMLFQKYCLNGKHLLHDK